MSGRNRLIPPSADKLFFPRSFPADSTADSSYRSSRVHEEVWNFIFCCHFIIGREVGQIVMNKEGLHRLLATGKKEHSRGYQIWKAACSHV